jgi:hypothetical protein
MQRRGQRPAVLPKISSSAIARFVSSSSAVSRNSRAPSSVKST